MSGSKLTFMEECEQIGTRRYGLYKCDCGTIKRIRICNVTSLHTISCGCHNTEVITRHGKSRCPLYRILMGMMSRCDDKNLDRYGGRGILVCDEWRNDPTKFIKWAYENGYSTGKQIDRNDNNDNYTPDNCRFVTRKKNSQNTMNSKWWYVYGVRYGAAIDAAKYHNVSKSTIIKWCNGTIYPSGRIKLPKDNCWSELKYSE